MVLKSKVLLALHLYSYCNTFVSGSGRVGQQSNCINKPVILFSCVFRKKKNKNKNHGSEIGRLKEGHSYHSGEYKSIKLHGSEALIDWNILVAQ